MNIATSTRPTAPACSRTTSNGVGDSAVCASPAGHGGHCDFIGTMWLCHGHDYCRAVLPAYAARIPWLVEDGENPRPHHARCTI